ncbi:winged helix-turn-helix transcriptional regulator [Mycobacterium sp.]|uniref:winged helix-turn-helix transcriptional regulator n=1 Tax=Mycobacterium sp. TaxID=1785 RepID=UPI003D09FBC7
MGNASQRRSRTDGGSDAPWDRDKWDLEPDSVALALGVLAPPTMGKVMREAFYGARRFEDFHRRTGISLGVLSARLRELISQGLLVKVPYQEPNSRVREEYRLTDKGRDLIPTMVAMIDWADRWLTSEKQPTVTLRHRGCGAPVKAVLTCSLNHEIDAGHDIIASPGPGALPCTGLPRS